MAHRCDPGPRRNSSANVQNLELEPVGVAEEDRVAVRLVVVLARRLDDLGSLAEQHDVHLVDVRAVAGVEGDVVKPGAR